MLNTRFSVSLIVIGWLCLSASLCAQPLSFMAPEERPQLEASKPWPENQFLVLAYHDVEDDAADQRYLSVRTSALNEQISWLLHNGYHAISVQDIVDAHEGKKALPPKAVLLSFDDGYSSFYTRVWPLLQAWNVPALWAPVGSWVDTPANQKVNFGGLMTPAIGSLHGTWYASSAAPRWLKSARIPGPRITASRPTRREAVNPLSPTVFSIT